MDVLVELSPTFEKQPIASAVMVFDSFRFEPVQYRFADLTAELEGGRRYWLFLSAIGATQAAVHWGVSGEGANVIGSGINAGGAPIAMRLEGSVRPIPGPGGAALLGPFLAGGAARRRRR